MTKEVLLTISGLQYTDPTRQEDFGNEPVLVSTPATYYYRNGKHYVLYEESTEGESEGIHNKIRITEDGTMEVMRSGLFASHMIFEKGKSHSGEYRTPYGEMTVGIFTTDMKVDVKDRDIDVSAAYALTFNDEKVADCTVEMNIKAKEKDRLPD